MRYSSGTGEGEGRERGGREEGGGRKRGKFGKLVARIRQEFRDWLAKTFDDNSRWKEEAAHTHQDHNTHHSHNTNPCTKVAINQ